MVEREVTRRYVDASRVEIRVNNGVCYLRGKIRPLRSHPQVDLDREVAIIQKILRQRPELRSVVWEVETVH